VARLPAPGRTAVLVVVLAAAVVAALAWRLGPWADRWRLPSRIVIEETVADLSAGFARTAVLSEAPGTPVASGGLQPGGELAVEEAYRRAILAPPPAEIRFRVRVPAGARLHFGAGVQRDGETDPDAVGVRFVVSVGGEERWSRVINPAARRRHRHWFDEEIDLGRTADGEVDVRLHTEPAEPGGRTGGTPGWSHVRVVRVLERERQPAGAGPNVLVLLVDTLRADALGTYGARPSPSPVLDRLAARGQVFEQMVSQASWTLPAVATLLTGLYPPSHGVVAGQHEGAAPPGAADPSFLSDAIPTLATTASLAGITTFAVSATPLVSRDTNLLHGFESHVQLDWDAERSNWAPAERVDDAFLAWLERSRGHRFFAYLHYMEPHDPYTPPAALRPPAPPGVNGRLAAGVVAPAALAIDRRGAPPLPAATVAYLHALYLGEVAAWDAALGRLLAGLDAAGIGDSTVVVVVSDHGEEFQEHGKLKHGIHLYDELLRVPLVIAGPGIAPARVGAQVQGVDLFPTVARLLGLTAPPGLPGQDVLAAPVSRPAWAETRYGIAPDDTPATLVALRTPDRKLIRVAGTERIQIFHLPTDPGEHDDRAATDPDAPALLAELVAMEADMPPPPEGGGGHDPRLQQKLRALGYVE
jgi:arylsulfatase A-like enzyme